MLKVWQTDPADRPDFTDIILLLEKSDAALDPDYMNDRVVRERQKPVLDEDGYVSEQVVQTPSIDIVI